MSITFRRNYKLLIAAALIVAALVAGLWDRRIVAYTTGGGGLKVAQPGVDYRSDVDLWDQSVVHTVQILISEADYQQMIATYQETGAKDYFHADIVIDGVRVNDAGIRLKGFSSLRTALGGGGGGDMPGMGGRPGFDPNNMPNPGDRPGFDPGDMPNPGQGRPEGGQAPQDGDMPFGQGGLAEEGDGKIPFLVKFDEFVSGQTYQGYSRLAIRTYGGQVDHSMLQEPVTNAVFRLAGLPAPQTAYAGLRLNDEAEQLYVIAEVIDETYLAQHFDNPDGVLYKAEVGSSLTYAGEDPTAYVKSFSQETRVTSADMAPLIAFMRFLAESDDATFERDLPEWLDVDAFATYLAINNLLVNVDSIAGMSNNYYLYYDDQARRFTLLMWDGNESLGKIGGGSRAAPGLAAPGLTAPGLTARAGRAGRAGSYDLYFKGAFSFGGGRSGPMGRANVLVTRFLASPTFIALYESKLQQVYRQTFAGGALTQMVEQYAGLVRPWLGRQDRQANQTRSLVDPDAYEEDVAAVLDFIAERGAYLAATPLLGGQIHPAPGGQIHPAPGGQIHPAPGGQIHPAPGGQGSK